MLTTSIIVALALATAPEVSVTQLDGTTSRGEFVALGESQVTIEAASGERRWPLSEVIALSLNHSQPPRAERKQLARLVDGSVIPIHRCQVEGGQATLELDIANADGSLKLDVPLGLVAALELQPLTAAAARQWQEIRAAPISGDLLVVSRKEGESLDYVDGVVGDISADSVEFTLDGDAIAVKREKVAGVIYYRSNQTELERSSCVVHGAGGLRLQALRLRLEQDQVSVETTAGVNMRLPVASIDWIDYSAGKVVYLSDLEPVVSEWTPLIDLPEFAELARRYGQPRRDQSFFGQPLAVWVAPAAKSFGEGQQQEFAKGLALRSRTELSYRLPPGYRRFVATVGIEPQTRSQGNLQLMVRGDDEVLYEAHLDGSSPPLELDLDIAGYKLLTFLVDYGDNLDTGDMLNLCEARVTK